MTKLAIQKIFVILDKQDEKQLERLCRTLSGLFSHVNLTSNLYLIADNLTEGMPQVERFQKEVSAFLRANLFARLYLHFVHHAPSGTVQGMSFYFQYYYQIWKQAAREFDQEGYMHQEIPRLMLLPVLVPDNRAEPTSLTALLAALKSAFFLPSLYLNRDTFFLAGNDDLLARTEKVYWGHGKSGDKAQIVCDLCYQDILDDTSSRLEPDPASMTDPCPAALIISARDGMVYACMDAFFKKKSLGNIYGNLGLDTLMARYCEYANSQRDCLACREGVVGSFSDLPLPEATTHEVGDLLYHFGTLHQEAENHIIAIERYEKSLKLSPVEEAGPIHFRLGLSYTTTGRYDEALESFSRAELTYKDQYYFHFYTGLCCFEKGEYRAALEKLSKAIQMKPQEEDLVRILIYMGTCYNSLEDYDQALIHLERAKEKTPNVKEIYNAIGFSCFQLKDYDKAIENLRIAVKLDPNSAVDYASLGANYREKGDSNLAITMYEKALALDPSIATARENLEKLRKQTMTRQDFSSLENELGYEFKDIGFLQEAMQHSSYVNEQRDPALKDNERLEFLGDAVLDLVITHILMDHFPETREGDLSRMRATIVNESQLAIVAQELKLGEHMLLGKGEALSHGQEKSSILADALEAVIAAVYLDSGPQAAFEVIERQFSQIISHVGERVAAEDFKSQLQELVQGRFKTIPHYEVVAESGPDHDKTFEVRLDVGASLTTHGTGKSKKSAEQAAASAALEKLQEKVE